MATFTALIAPDQMFRVGDTLHQFKNGTFETQDPQTIEFLRANGNVAEVSTAEPIEDPIEDPARLEVPTDPGNKKQRK